MLRLSAVLVSANPYNTEYILDFLNMFDYNIVDNTQYGFDCINLILNKKPNVVICDSLMYDLDACSLYTQLAEFGVAKDIVFVVISNINDPSFTNLVMNCGIDHFALIPTDFFTLDKKIRKLANDKLNVSQQVKPALKITGVNKVVEFDFIVYLKSLLHELGMNAKLSGYKYVIDAVLILLSNSEAVYNKDIYPVIAKKYMLSGSAIEAGIRHAIEKSWSIGNLSVLEDVFSYTYKPSKFNPSNTEYISMLVEKIKLHFEII